MGLGSLIGGLIGGPIGPIVGAIGDLALGENSAKRAHQRNLDAAG